MHFSRHLYCYSPAKPLFLYTSRRNVDFRRPGYEPGAIAGANRTPLATMLRVGPGGSSILRTREQNFSGFCVKMSVLLLVWRSGPELHAIFYGTDNAAVSKDRSFTVIRNAKRAFKICLATVAHHHIEVRNRFLYDATMLSERNFVTFEREHCTHLKRVISCNLVCGELASRIRHKAQFLVCSSLTEEEITKIRKATKV